MKRSSYQSEAPNSAVVKTANSSASEPVPIASPSRKKPYKPPKVTEYGNVARLTAGMNGTGFDPGHATRSKLGGG
jgi:hypothetical protein